MLIQQVNHVQSLKEKETVDRPLFALKTFSRSFELESSKARHEDLKV